MKSNALYTDNFTPVCSPSDPTMFNKLHRVLMSLCALPDKVIRSGHSDLLQYVTWLSIHNLCQEINTVFGPSHPDTKYLLSYTTLSIHKTITKTVNPPYIPDLVSYHPTDIYARFFAPSIDIDLVSRSYKVCDRVVRMEFVESIAGIVATDTAIYCGKRLGSGVIECIRVIGTRWTIATVMFWTRSRHNIAPVCEGSEDMGEMARYDIAFPTDSFDFYVPAGIQIVVDSDF